MKVQGVAVISDDFFDAGRVIRDLLYQLVKCNFWYLLGGTVLFSFGIECAADPNDPCSCCFPAEGLSAFCTLNSTSIKEGWLCGRL